MITVTEKAATEVKRLLASDKDASTVRCRARRWEADDEGRFNRPGFGCALRLSV